MATIYLNKQERDCVLLEVGGKYYPFYVGWYGKPLTEKDVSDSLGCTAWDGRTLPVPIMRDNETLTPEEVGRYVGEKIGTLAHEIR